MGASDRDKRSVMRPRPVLIRSTWADDDRVKAGLLLEWKRVRTGRRDRWLGLVAHADGGGELNWSLKVEWMLADYLRPVGEADPPRENTER